MSTYRRMRRARQVANVGEAGIVVPVDDALGRNGERRYLAATGESLEGLTAAYWAHNDNPATYNVAWTDGGVVLLDDDGNVIWTTDGNDEPGV